MPNVIGFIKWYLHYAKRVLRMRGMRLVDKLLLLLHLITALFDKNYFVKHAIYVKIRDTWFRLIDLESIAILDPEFEWWMWKYLRLKESDVFVDVGAHIGKYSLPAARIVGDYGIVIAIEPSPDTFRALLDGIRRNGLTNIIALNVAAWDRDAVLKLFIKEARGQSTVLDNVGNIRTVKIENVLARRLDDIVKGLNLEKVNYVKIDVEGAEVNVLKGFMEGLIKYKPKVVIEIKRFNLDTVLSLFSSLKYSCSSIPEDVSSEYYYCESIEQIKTYT